MQDAKNPTAEFMHHRPDDLFFRLSLCQQLSLPLPNRQTPAQQIECRQKQQLSQLGIAQLAHPGFAVNRGARGFLLGSQADIGSQLTGRLKPLPMPQFPQNPRRTLRINAGNGIEPLLLLSQIWVMVNVVLDLLVQLRPLLLQKGDMQPIMACKWDDAVSRRFFS
jgi:hypothetical protein